jgi:hypothetical protein
VLDRVPERSPQCLQVAFVLSWQIIVLAALAAALGLMLPSVYRETTWVVPQNRGQDLVTLLALAVMVPTQLAAQRGSPRANLIWLGLLGYLAYTYTGAAFAYAFNQLFLIYVALFGATGAALIAGLAGIDASAMQRAFDERAPHRSVMAFLLTMAAVLCPLWFSQIIPFFTHGELPTMIVMAKTPTVFVYVLDLGVVVPLALLSARWLWQRKAWGYVLAGFVLVKAATMGLSLLSMTVFSLRAGVQIETVLSLAWVTLAISGLTMSWWFFRHCSSFQGLAVARR